VGKIDDAIAPLRDRFNETWGGLSQRERRIIGLMIAAFLAVVVVLTFTSARRTLAQHELALENKRLGMERIAQLAQTYRQAQTARERIEARIRGNPVRLFSYLEELAKRKDVVLGDMQDRGTDDVSEGVQRSTVEVSFARIDLRSLTGFLNEIEKSPHLVKVEKLRFRGRNDDPNLLDATVTVSTYQLVGS
jgi:general secretion pathway protein M